MTERATYGELMGQAAHRMAEASGLLATQPLPNRAQTLGAVAAYCNLVTAVRGAHHSCFGWSKAR